MKSKYKKVLFSILAFGGNIRYISLLSLPTNSYCVFLIFVSLLYYLYLYKQFSLYCKQ